MILRPARHPDPTVNSLYAKHAGRDAASGWRWSVRLPEGV
jgi:hypothetical protein